MKSYKEYINEVLEELNEKLITFGGKAYPKFGNVVILAGGAGSGKGFVKKNLVGLEGMSFDVDELKSLAIRSDKIEKIVKDETGMDFAELRKTDSLKNPDNVALLHDLIGSVLKLDKKQKSTFYQSVLVSAPDRKPNIIFDVTLRDLTKLASISRDLEKLGYEKDKIHIVWIINDIEVAKSQNLSRSRTVPTEILVNTHRGVSQTMNDIINMGNDLKKYLDGDIVFAFNKIGIDSELVKSGKGGQYIKTSNYFYVKKAGQTIKSTKELDKEIRAKIKEYVPKNVDW
jgi:hypothetical protein